MKKSFMTRALAMGLSLAMAFSLSAATNVSVASAAATPAMASKQFAVRVGGAAKSYKASAATQKSFKITKATVGNTDKATVKVNSSKKSIKVTPGTVTGTTVVKVTFKNIKTAKTTAKKYRCVVKAAIEQKPAEPEVVKATKITEAKVSTAKTMTVTFDGAVDTSSATAIKVMRGSTEAPVTVTYASDSKSAVLTSATPFAAGTYTITVGSFEPATVAVVKQTPTTLTITNTTVANTKGAYVGFQVLDQYGEPMENYTGKKLTVQAYNTSKGHSINVNTNTNKAYFELDCATQDLGTGAQYINAIDDTVNVVAYLTDNAGVSTTATLKIANIYMEDLEFGEPELGTDKRVTVGKTYKLPYTAKTNEGNDSKFGEVSTGTPGAISRVFGNYTFVSSNASAVDMGKIYVDKDNQMFFTAENTPGTAVITAINNMTGVSTTITIVVNDVPKMSSLDVAETSISWDTNESGTKPVEIKAAVTVYDQFGEVVDPKNVRNVNLLATNNYFTGNPTVVPGTSGILASKISSDGKYLVYTVDASTAARYALKGQTITFTYISKAAGEKGYITSTSKVLISDTIEPAALTIVTDPAASVVSGKAVKVKFSVYDQNQNKVALTWDDSKSAYKYTTQKLNDRNEQVTYYVCVENSNNLFSAVTKGAVDTDKKEYELKMITKLTGVANTDIARTAQFSISLKDDTRRVTTKSYNLSVIKEIEKYFVSTDSDKYSAGDKVKVTVDAYSQGGALFNSLYNDTADVQVKLTGAENKTFKFSPKFENGVAELELTAGKAGNYTVTVSSLNNGITTMNTCTYKVVGAGTAKLNAKATGILEMVDSQGNPIKNLANDLGSYETYATVSVVDVTAGNKDITDKVYLDSVALRLTNNNKVKVKITKGQNDTIISELDDIAGYDVKELSVVVKNECTTAGAGTGHFIKLTISVGDYSWSVDAQATANAVYFNAAASALDTDLLAMKTAQINGNKVAFADALEGAFKSGGNYADSNYQAVSGAAATAEIASNSALLVETMYGKITSIADMQANMLGFNAEMTNTKSTGDAIVTSLGSINITTGAALDTDAAKAKILQKVNQLLIDEKLDDDFTVSVTVTNVDAGLDATGTNVTYTLVLTSTGTYKTTYYKTSLTATTA